jgi:hypothetical protein
MVSDDLRLKVPLEKKNGRIMESMYLKQLG